METRVAVISIIVEDLEQAAFVNDLLHKYAPFIAGRMGVPMRDKGISVIAVIADAPEDEIAALSGKLGRIENVTVKVSYSKK